MLKQDAMETTSESRQSDFLCTDDKFRLIERVLIKRRHWVEDVWERRIKLSLDLAEFAHTPKEKKFRFGIFCYLGWLFWQVRKVNTVKEILDIVDSLRNRAKREAALDEFLQKAREVRALNPEAAGEIASFMTRAERGNA
jgi:hypothetical protein